MSKIISDKKPHFRLTGMTLNAWVNVGYDQENKRVLRKIDMWLMPVILLVYFFSAAGQASGFLPHDSLSLKQVRDIHSHKTRLAYLKLRRTGWNLIYSWLSSIVYLAQLIWQPASSYFLVKLPIAKYLFVNVFMWGAVVACTAAAHDFKGLLAGRFFLGIFEATVALCFMTITQMRRHKQTMRLSRGIGMVGSLLAWGLGRIGRKLHAYQTAGPAEMKNYTGTVKTNIRGLLGDSASVRPPCPSCKVLRPHKNVTTVPSSMNENEEPHHAVANGTRMND
ncbi:uncharacterized protein BT62DRAFT_1012191 [Guyanagaster necrorhizus]|uniref:Uncharacterized protein n=1 Tax=Guyanagaster necrorhizus TaxID=856835 RepID=A0A9P8AMJ4_9AGAR|nr:uncharacterized protein BT62DRAFT_1012191 [Guyanagaster necrorhizus MCA 3950]KAG7440975.1 hypothetical protein BT62DRAFT_1012191 [Guyanagaster necrorhizus MCA 3950]